MKPPPVICETALTSLTIGRRASTYIFVGARRTEPMVSAGDQGQGDVYEMLDVARIWRTRE